MGSVEYIGRQPIIDHNGELIGYDLLYDDSSHTPEQTSSLIASIINTFCVNNTLNNTQGFIKIDTPFLMSGVVFSVPKSLFVLSLSVSMELTDTALERLRELKELGFRFALHDITYLSEETLPILSPLFAMMSYVKVSMTHLSQEYMAKLKHLLEPYPLGLIATHVDTQQDYAIAKSLGYPYIEGYYFSEPVNVEHQKVDSKHFTLIRLYNMLMSSATTTEELSSTFESNPELTLQLLQYINSSAFSFRYQISSITQVLTLLGRKPLAQWLLLLMYGKHMNHSPTQTYLMQMVSRRATLMRGFFRLLSRQNPHTDEDEAFFVGVMSLSSALMSTPLRLILKDMNLSETITSALLSHEGILGELLGVVEAIEHFDIEKIRQFIERYRLSPPAVLALISQTAITPENDISG